MEKTLFLERLIECSTACTSHMEGTAQGLSVLHTQVIIGLTEAPHSAVSILAELNVLFIFAKLIRSGTTPC